MKEFKYWVLYADVANLNTSKQVEEKFLQRLCKLCYNKKCVFITWNGKYKNNFNTFYTTNFYFQFFLFFKYTWIWYQENSFEVLYCTIIK